MHMTGRCERKEHEWTSEERGTQWWEAHIKRIALPTA